MARHSWYDLAYDARLSVNQPRRALLVCTRCGIEMDKATNWNASWVVGWRLSGGKRFAQTSYHFKAPTCAGRLPTPAEVEAWNARVKELAAEGYGQQARGYAL